MRCRRCGWDLERGDRFCAGCRIEVTAYCVQCGATLSAHAATCLACQQSQPVAGAPRVVGPAPRYTNSKNVFNIAVPPPWEVAERNVLGVESTVIDRPDVRSGGFRGLMQNLLSIGSAGLQIWIIPVQPGADASALNQAYINFQYQVAARGGSGGAAGALPMLMASPSQRHDIALEGAHGVALDFRHSLFGMAETTERRFLVLSANSSMSAGVVMVTQAPTHEFARWEKDLWNVARSFRFGTDQTDVVIDARAIENHLPPLRVAKVDSALGWAWLVDMGQGNFAVAREAAEEALAQQRDADTLFARAVVHQLQGEYANAFPLFEEAFECTPDLGRKFVIASMARLAEHQRGHVLPDGNSIDFAEAELRWGSLLTPTEWLNRSESQSREAQAPHSALEANVIREASSLLSSQRHIVSSPAGEAERAELLSKFTADFVRLIQTAHTDGTQWLFTSLIGRLADLNAWAGKATEALALLDDLKKVYHEQDNPIGEGWCALCRGDIGASPRPLGRPVMFGHYLRDSLTSTTVPTDPELFDRSRINITATRAAYVEAGRCFVQANAPRGIGMARMRLAYLDGIEGRWANAAQGYAEAQRTFDTAGDQLNAWSATAGCLWARMRLGEPELDLIQEVQRLAHETKEKDALSTGLGWGLAFAYAGRDALAMQGEVDTALRAANMAEKIFAVFNAPLRQAQVCCDRAEALDAIGAVDQSLAESSVAFDKLQHAATYLTDRTLDIKLLSVQLAQGLIGLYAEQRDTVGLGSVRKSIEALIANEERVSEAEFETIKRRLGQAQGSTLSLHNMMNMDEQEDAYRKLKLSMLYDAARQMEADINFYEPLSNGLRAMEAGRDDEAAPFFEQAVAAAKKNSSRDLLLAITFSAWRKYDEAKTALRKYLEASMPGVFQKFGDIMAALSPSQAATQYTRQQIGHRWHAVSLFAQTKAWDEAREQLTEIEKVIGPPKPLAELPTRNEIERRSDYGLISEELGDRTQALAYAGEAFRGLESRRRYLRQESMLRALSSQRKTRSIYAAYTRLLADNGDWPAAFEVAEMVRARVLSEALGSARAVTRALGSDDTYQQYMEQMAAIESLHNLLAMVRRTATPDAARIALLQTKLGAARKQLDECEEALTRKLPRWRELSAPQPEALSLSAVAEHLPEGTLLLAYLFQGERLLAWAVTRDGQLVAQSSVTEFEKKPFLSRPFAARVLRCVELLGGEDGPARSANDDSNLDEELAQILIKPFDAQIDSAHHLLIVPFGELNMCPFQALPWRGGPLGLSKSISYLPAASLVKYFRDPDLTATGALVVGDPADMSYEEAGTGNLMGLDPLPAARVEARVIAEMHKVEPIVGERATEDFIRDEIARNPRVIHFATHGFLQEGAPLASGIALAKGNALSADEMMGLKLTADVVVLSACETGRGKLQGSELVGLARGLIYAGARAAIVSLWKVDDVATAMLMQLLHQGLCNGEETARALQQAQRKLTQVTAQQALNFCAAALHELSSQSEMDQVEWANLTCLMGCVLAQGEDYAGVASAYEVAVNALDAAGHTRLAEKRRMEYTERYLERVELAAEDQSVFIPDKKIFDSPRYWAAFEIIGDWR